MIDYIQPHERIPPRPRSHLPLLILVLLLIALFAAGAETKGPLVEFNVTKLERK